MKINDLNDSSRFHFGSIYGNYVREMDVNEDGSYTSTTGAMIKIYKSANGLFYPIATYREETHVGNSTGEVSFINFAEATEIENVRIVVVTPAYFKKFQISIAEVGLFE